MPATESGHTGRSEALQWETLEQTEDPALELKAQRDYRRANGGLGVMCAFPTIVASSSGRA
jgi:hypothetical protein